MSFTSIPFPALLNVLEWCLERKSVVGRDAIWWLLHKSPTVNDPHHSNWMLTLPLPLLIIHRTDCLTIEREREREREREETFMVWNPIVSLASSYLPIKATKRNNNNNGQFTKLFNYFRFRIDANLDLFWLKMLFT